MGAKRVQIYTASPSARAPERLAHLWQALGRSGCQSGARALGLSVRRSGTQAGPKSSDLLGRALRPHWYTHKQVNEGIGGILEAQIIQSATETIRFPGHFKDTRSKFLRMLICLFFVIELRL